MVDGRFQKRLHRDFETIVRNTSNKKNADERTIAIVTVPLREPRIFSILYRRRNCVETVLLSVRWDGV